MFKNTAGQRHSFTVFNRLTSELVTGDDPNITMYVNRDDAGPVAIAAAVVEVDPVTAQGCYEVALTQEETNGDKLVFTGVSTTPNVVIAPMTIYTRAAVTVASDGSVVVDHDYGGTDALAIELENGVRVDNATIVAYRTEDWDAGRRSQTYAVDSTTTDVDGRWLRPFQLDPDTYVLLVYKQGSISSLVYNLTVTPGTP